MAISAGDKCEGKNSPDGHHWLIYPNRELRLKADPRWGKTPVVYDSVTCRYCDVSEDYKIKVELSDFGFTIQDRDSRK